MLSSIHPLGERARNQHWTVTAMAYIVAASIGGTLTGLAAGSIGGLVTSVWKPPGLIVALALSLLAAVGFWVDLTARPIPTLHRQVNEDWLDEYRGWVYGIGFGFQLGLGWTTIITTSLIYLTFGLAAVTASPALGAIIGLTFGLSRSLPILLGVRIQNPRQLLEFHKQMDAWRPRVTKLAAATQAITSASSVAAVVLILG